LALVFAAISSATFLTFRDQWGYLFNNDQSVVRLVASILPVLALFQVFDALNGVAAGIMRARGMQFAGALLNISAYYMLGIPFGLWLAFQRNMGLHGLWYGLTVSLVYGSVVSVWMGLHADWKRESEKVQKRLEAAKANQDEYVRHNGGGEHV